MYFISSPNRDAAESIKPTMLSTESLLATFETFERQTLDSIAQARNLKWPEPYQVGFSTSNLSEAEVNRVKEKLPKCSQNEIKAKTVGYLYVFAQSQGCSVRREDILDAIQSAKSGGKNKEKAVMNLCAINAEAPEGRVLYVGRSWDPRTRVSGHMRASNSKTYAIHFAAWAHYLDLKVDLFVYKFPAIPGRVLQLLEDVTWDTLVPLLGRRGEK
jgi:hypothetical protein